MTEREREIYLEGKRRIYFRRGGVCEICEEHIPFEQTQLAHRIPQDVENLNAFGPGIIHNQINVGIACDLECNKVVDIGEKPSQINKISMYIQEFTHGEHTESEAEKWLYDNFIKPNRDTPEARRIRARKKELARNRDELSAYF